MSSFLSLRWNASVASGDRYSSPPSRYGPGYLTIDTTASLAKSLFYIARTQRRVVSYRSSILCHC